MDYFIAKAKLLLMFVVIIYVFTKVKNQTVVP